MFAFIVTIIIVYYCCYLLYIIMATIIIMITSTISQIMIAQTNHHHDCRLYHHCRPCNCSPFFGELSLLSLSFFSSSESPPGLHIVFKHDHKILVVEEDMNLIRIHVALYT